METCYHNADVFNGFSIAKNCGVLIKSHKIIDVFNEERFRTKKFKEDTKFIDLKGKLIAPGFIDTHIHGLEGFGTEDHTTKAILMMSQSLVKYGVTSFIPTLYSSPKAAMIKDIKAIVKAMGQEKGAQILGLHLEGPFISSKRLGAQKADSLSPVDLKLMDELWKASEGHIINMTVAPELKNMRELALFCVGKGIVLQAGHTDATYKQMLEGMQCRITHTTHLFNAMSRIHHRDPGAVGAVLIHPEMSCELIADGIHVNPDLIKLLAANKPMEKLVLVTDALKPTEQKKGPFIANGVEVYFDKCFYAKPTASNHSSEHAGNEGVIAGSGLTMIKGVRNLVDFGLPLDHALMMASANPARIMRLEHKGLIAPGYDADLVILDNKLEVKTTIIAGKIYNF